MLRYPCCMRNANIIRTTSGKGDSMTIEMSKRFNIRISGKTHDLTSPSTPGYNFITPCADLKDQNLVRFDRQSSAD